MEIIPSSEELKKQIMVTIDVAWRNRLENQVIERWLSNFTGEALGDAEYERQLALWLLYNFTYINEEEVKHLCRLLFRKYIHMSIEGIEAKEESISQIMKKSTFLPLGRRSESGSYVLYMFRQENEIPVTFFGDDDGIPEGNKIVFIDDMTLSGSQALRNIARVKYGDYQLKAPLSDAFMMFLKDGTTLTDKQSRIIKLIVCDRSNRDKVKNFINNQILKDTLFYEKHFIDCKLNDVDPILKELLTRYISDRDNMSNYIIYKMNRLLLEYVFPEAIPKSREVIANDRMILLAFFASERAKKKFAAENIEVINCIDLDDMSSAFSDTSMVFYEFESDKKNCKKMCEYYGSKIKPDAPLGFDDCQYLIGLFYSIPNNTLPVFWGDKNWNPIFVRHEKKYGGTINVKGKFI